MRYSAPAAQGGERLNLDRGRSKFSKYSKEINHIRTLNAIAAKWVAMGCYQTQGRALQALIGGEL